MGNPEKKPIVFISNLTPEWLESGLRLAACGIERDPWKEQMVEIISQTSKGAENIRKSLRYLRHIYIEPTEYTELRAEAFNLYNSSTELKREKIISWGLAILTYPFLNEVSATLGRLLRVQNDVKLELKTHCRRGFSIKIQLGFLLVATDIKNPRPEAGSLALKNLVHP